MSRFLSLITAVSFLLLLSCVSVVAGKVPITAVGLPLADHYAAIVAYEKYHDQMQEVDFHFKILPGPELVRAAFLSDSSIDVAFNVAPMVLDMFAQTPTFKWVSLVHRDGNALAINLTLLKELQLPSDKRSRLPDAKLASAIRSYKQNHGGPVRIAIPSKLSTHSAILYKYLRDQGLSFGFQRSDNVDVLLEIVKPPNALTFLKKQDARARAAAFEQSLPWPELSESANNGRIAWYSKDVMSHDKGHVECIAIAKNETIRNKRAALAEVITYLHRAGEDIEIARRQGGGPLDEIVTLIQRHIPAHSRDAILQSLRDDLYTINYLNLNIDENAKQSMLNIMELSLEAGFLAQQVDLDQLVDESFNSPATE